MESPHIDIERMVMQSQYKLSLETASAHTVSNMNDMERKEYQDKIRELLGAVTTLLDANKSMGERLEKAKSTISKANDEIDALKTRIAQFEGENAMRRRNTYGKNGEKSSPVADKGKTKDERECDYIEREGRQSSVDCDKDDESEGDAGAASTSGESFKRDTSNRPSHYNKMHADVCVVHDCDMERLKELGYEFVRYSRPVDQFDRISVVRQARYLYAWVRDNKGNEFEYFVPKKGEERPCIFENESNLNYS